MKVIISFAIMMSALTVFAQHCTGPEHSTNPHDSWLTCEAAPSPNPERVNGYWILYDFGFNYRIGDTYFWNYNVEGKTQHGIKTLAIDYSLDGIDWEHTGVSHLEEASGRDDYIGMAGPHLNAIECRYVLLTATEMWGGDCAGLSEVRFDLDQVSALNAMEEHSSFLDIAPNPVSNALNIQSYWQIDEVMIISSFGQEYGRYPYQKNLDISHLPDGVYMLMALGSDGEKATRKFVKQGS